MRVVGVLVVAAACSEPAPSVVADAAIDVMPDACPLPNAYPECMPHGFAQLNPDGAWHMSGTTTTQIEQNPPMTTALEQDVTIQRTGCGAMLSYEYPNAIRRVDDTVIESICNQGICIRTTSTAHVCVRASDGALIYARTASHTSTMPGNYYSTEESSAVLTPIQ